MIMPPTLFNRLSAAAEPAKRWWFHLEDYCFEKWHQIELGGVVTHADLISCHSDSLPHATAYHAVWCRNLRELVQEALKTGIQFHSFVDIGSGKGKACFYVSRYRTFSSILGVEFSEPLVATAARNQRAFRSERITFLQADASTFVLPDCPTLVFMFNPFSDVIMHRFLESNRSHFTLNDSAIAYANDKQRHTLAMHGFEAVFRNQTRNISLWRPYRA
jgi:SAM-dependent methyltransferase